MPVRQRQREGERAGDWHSSPPAMYNRVPSFWGRVGIRFATDSAAEAMMAFACNRVMAFLGLAILCSAQSTPFAQGSNDLLPKPASVPELITKLKDKDVSVRINAAMNLSFIGPAAKAAVPALVQAFEDENAFVREFVASALGSIGPDAIAGVA